MANNLSIRALELCVVYPVIALALLAQTPQTDDNQATHHSYNAFWTTEDEHITTLLIRNVHRKDTISVSTVLHRPDGRRIRLQVRAIPPLTTIAVAVGNELATLNEPQGRGSAHFTYTHNNSGVILAEPSSKTPGGRSPSPFRHTNTRTLATPSNRRDGSTGSIGFRRQPRSFTWRCKTRPPHRSSSRHGFRPRLGAGFWERV